MLDALRDHANRDESLLDVGGGVGVIDLELLANGIRSATLIDASSAYLDAAGREAEARQVADRLHRVVGDFAVLEESITPADIVTMHRIVCCYPDHVALLQAATKHARRVFAFSYPRDRWYIRFWLGLENLRRLAFGNPFRTFVHAPATMEARVARAGFVRIHRSRTLVWTIDVYARTMQPSAD